MTTKTSKFKSKLEERLATLFSTLGVKYEYESEKICYTIQHHYCPDFVLPNHVYLEAKGYWSPADRRKILAVKKDNPDMDSRMVFQAPYNKINKKKVRRPTQCFVKSMTFRGQLTMIYRLNG